MKKLKGLSVLAVACSTACDPSGPFSVFDSTPLGNRPTMELQADAAIDGGPAAGGAPGALDDDAGGIDASGGQSALGTGGGGMPGAGGTAEDACSPVTHDNGLGQSWTDCAPLGTRTEVEALRACRAWCAVNDCAGGCYSGPLCGTALVAAQIGISGPDVVGMGWTWKLPFAGSVVRISSTTQACSPVDEWN